MGIKVNVTWKIKINGKEYSSVEEMPSDIREAYEKARGAPRARATKILFNGQEYENIEAMPHDVRRVYDQVMRAAESGEVSSEVLSGAEFKATIHSQSSSAAARLVTGPKPIEPESILSLSPRTLIVGLVVLILFVGLYYLIAG